jgi:peroxiredoxin
MPKVDINTLAPDFSLQDYIGNPVRLQELTKESNVLLVFNRGFI